MAVYSIQTSFAAGEIAPALYGHVDLSKTRVAVTTGRNAFVSYRGGMYSRAGTALCNRSRQTFAQAPPIVINFQFNINQGYALEFGDQYMRVYADGSPIVEATDAITGATNANPCVLTVANAYSNGDWVIINGVGGMTQLNGNTYIVAAATGTHITLHDLNGNAVNSTAYGVYTAGGTTARIFTLVTPWAAADLPYLKYTQSADVMSLCCVNQATGAEYLPYDLARISPTNWTITASTFASNTPAPASCTATATVHPSGATSPPTLPTAYAYAVTAVNVTTGEESVASPVANVTDSVDISSTAGSNIVDWAAVSVAGSYNIYKAPPSYNTDPGNPTNALPVPAGALFGYCGSSYGTEFIDSNIISDTQTVPPQHKNPFARGRVLSCPVSAGGSAYTSATTVTITSGTGSGFVGIPVITAGVIQAVIVVNAGSGYLSSDTLVFTDGAGTGAAGSVVVGAETGTYPGVVAYDQQRRVYAASINEPDTFWMSQPGKYLNFDSSIPTTSGDAITGTPWSQQVNGIQYMISMPGGLVVLTGLGAWQVGGAGGSATNPQPITPTSLQAIQQAFNGCDEKVAPLKINFDLLYVQSKGSIVRDLAWNYWINIYTGSDLTQLSGQLFKGFQITDSAWCEEPYRLAWFTRNDGVLLSITYLKEQEVYGWARHDTLGQFLFVTSVTEPPVDALYVVAARPCAAANGGYAYYIERMDNRLWVGPEDVWAVDCGLAYPMPTPSATLYASSNSGLVTFTATTAVFSSGDAGKVLRMGGGIATISLFISTTVLQGTWISPPTAITPDDPTNMVYPQFAGSWSITQPITTVTGLVHLAGLTVTGLADGVAITPQTVTAAGTINLGLSASNIKVGLPFTTQVQLPRFDPAGGPMTVQGRRKTIVAVTARVKETSPFTVGTNQPDGAAQNPPLLAPTWTGMQPVVSPATTYTAASGGTVHNFYTGDMRAVVGTQWAKPGQVAFQQQSPYQFNLLDVVPEYLEGDLPEVAFTAKQEEQRDPRAGPRGPGAWMLSGV